MHSAEHQPTQQSDDPSGERLHEETERLLDHDDTAKEKTKNNEAALLADPDEAGTNGEADNAELNRSLRSSEYARIAMQR